ncbi:hypothetical protein LTR56_022149 [Elasticomyces elasticus]|uniref:HTH cro/C1-type domain-containing protein n=1 Tax=Elasticomyces elasticus TaxID=574655 RepID=A0AAN7VKL9_9PEZI|nr:hypothetical protein LTR56_022149 [Elasticomyces elasticus]KAK3628606.1 hypothetical protein LTR22_022291 [Elasticomyces elasticus]KAK4913397.1 hypothetical protein LTR49_018285 [Elasticomyces elasticus]KAK5689594.1 hypothetical protein LTR97_012767 [Elasticomyces elasticus]KAK5717402.1 hypothetical protein LTR15_009296 [Elasticomyces elasticus]
MFTHSYSQSLRSWCTNRLQSLVLPRLHSTRRAYTDADDKFILACRGQKKTLRAIAEDLNRTLPSLESHVYNTMRRKQGGIQPIRPKRLFTNEDVNEAREMLATGLSRRDVARKMRVSNGQLRVILDNPRSQRQAKHALSEADIAKIISLRTEKKLTRSELARQTGWSFSTIRRTLWKRLGGAQRSSAALPYTAQEDDQLLTYRRQGLNYRETAALMPGRTVGSIGDRYRTYLRDNKHYSDVKEDDGDVHSPP